MDPILGILARSLVFFLQAFPLTWVARFGRVMGGLGYWLDGRHRRVAARNLGKWLNQPENSPQVRDIVKENFRRLGEAYCSGIKTASMSIEELLPHLETDGLEALVDWHRAHPERNLVAAIGHFGNFEIYARVGNMGTGFKCATTYRGLRQPSLDRLMHSLRSRSGCEFFERRKDATALKAAMSQGGRFLGLLADQHAGDRGIPLPFLGRTASTSVAPAVFAQRYDAPLCVAICYRVGLARWRIECSPFIPTHENGSPRDPAAIMTEVNRAYEQAIARDPANWFWVHNRWKEGKHRKMAASQPTPQTEIEPTSSEVGGAGQSRGT